MHVVVRVHEEVRRRPDAALRQVLLDGHDFGSVAEDEVARRAGRRR